MAKPRRSVATLDRELVSRLERGGAATRDLVEFLAIDLSQLFLHVTGWSEAAADPIRQSKGTTAKMRAAGELLAAQATKAELREWSAHPADTVRGFVAYSLPMRYPSVSDLLRAVRPFAADPHFSVREWAWLSVRPLLAQHLGASIQNLTPWTAEADPFLRRFAVEVLRPRGVWCSHIPELKESPELGLPLLNPLVAEPERYVQDSVANWLNDASKTRPDFVIELTTTWLSQSSNSSTIRMVRRARRTLPAET